MTAGQPLPTPEQIQTWLRAHGWTAESPIPADPEDGVDYTYKELSDDGQAIWVRVSRTPGSPPWYPLLVQDVVVTAAGMEDRPEADVLVEMLAIDATPAPRPPAAPVA